MSFSPTALPVTLTTPVFAPWREPVMADAIALAMFINTPEATPAQIAKADEFLRASKFFSPVVPKPYAGLPEPEYARQQAILAAVGVMQACGYELTSDVGERGINYAHANFGVSSELFVSAFEFGIIRGPWVLSRLDYALDALNYRNFTDPKLAEAAKADLAKIRKIKRAIEKMQEVYLEDTIVDPRDKKTYDLRTYTHVDGSHLKYLPTVFRGPLDFKEFGDSVYRYMLFQAEDGASELRYGKTASMDVLTSRRERLLVAASGSMKVFHAGKGSNYVPHVFFNGDDLEFPTLENEIAGHQQSYNEYISPNSGLARVREFLRGVGVEGAVVNEF